MRRPGVLLRAKMNFAPVKVIFHCSDTPDFVESSPAFDRYGADDIEAWHTGRGFHMIGYHWVIRRTGVIEKGRPLDMAGAHCTGENHKSFGVCYIGREKMTKAQIVSLNELALLIESKFQISRLEWLTHNTFNIHKTCPGFSTKKLRELLGV